ncbi:MAG TPA: DUF1580 domain-containing protein [Pirellulales bacterium]|nr:DUF1580 domain-containing protein [Pirellulales bacterium]
MLDAHLDLITLIEAAKLLPRRNGKKFHVITIKRWIRVGCRGVRLRAWKVGHEWFTTREALADFQDACTRKSLGYVRPTPAEIDLEARQAREDLRRIGFYGKDRTETAGKGKGKANEASGVSRP